MSGPAYPDRSRDGMCFSATVPVTIVPVNTGSVGVRTAPTTMPIHHGTPKNALTISPLTSQVPGMITRRTVAIAFSSLEHVSVGKADRDTPDCETERQPGGLLQQDQQITERDNTEQAQSCWTDEDSVRDGDQRFRKERDALFDEIRDDYQRQN